MGPPTRPAFLIKQLSRLPLFWRMQLVFWSAYFVHGCFSRTGYYAHVGMGVGMSLLLEPTEFLFSSGLRLAYRRWNRTVTFSPRGMGLIVLLSFAATLLQPVVENAFKHGLNTAEPPWELRVSITRGNGPGTGGNGPDLRIQVSNTGTLRVGEAATDRMEADDGAHGGGGNPGIGLANVRRRLELHYPGRHRFSLRQEGPLVIAEIRLEGEPCPV